MAAPPATPTALALRPSCEISWPRARPCAGLVICASIFRRPSSSLRRIGRSKPAVSIHAVDETVAFRRQCWSSSTSIVSLETVRDGGHVSLGDRHQQEFNHNGLAGRVQSSGEHSSAKRSVAPVARASQRSSFAANEGHSAPRFRRGLFTYENQAIFTQ